MHEKSPIFRHGRRRRRARIAAHLGCALVILAALHAGRALSQEKHRPVFDHRLVTVRAAGILPAGVSTPETLRVLAAMVQFLPDDDSRTSGNGLFNMTEPLSRTKDPPPHDHDYFELHMRFLQNYFSQVSDGAMTIEYVLLPRQYNLDSQMRVYSPPRNSENNAEIGRLAEDAWALIDSVTPGIRYEDFDAFLLFHAGTGRDIDLVSIYGYDPTPFDIPSLYLNMLSLRRMFGGAYEGIPVRGGGYHLTNTMIIPETESRSVAVIGGTVLLQLGINGLLAASIGSHLGLPDLFDTKTGRSGIGRFGLMDGQSIFSFNGFIPPEPSAWEKYFLGWISPVTLHGGDTVRELPAVGLGGRRDTIYRLPIGGGEYFLVENRNRDAHRDGSTVTAVWAGDTLTFTWNRDTVGFTAFDQDSLFGVLLDVDEFDWSLPGGVSSRTGEFFDGGTLIWHVDESVISANLADGTVNADPERRGVDLEEADGSQDIGQSYGFLSPGSGSEDGTVLDFWYEGNSAPLRVASNLFGPASHPPSSGNNNTNSHITVSEFSPRGPRMTARFTVGDSLVAVIPGFPLKTGASFQRGSVLSDGGGHLFAVSPGPGPKIFGWDHFGGPVDPGFDTSGQLPLPDSVTGAERFYDRPAVGHLNDNFYPDIVFAANDEGGGRLYAYEMRDADSDLFMDLIFATGLPHPVTAPPVLDDSVLAVGTGKGFVYLVGFDGTILSEHHLFSGDSSDVVSLSLVPSGGGFLAGSSTGLRGTVSDPCMNGGSGASSASGESGDAFVASGVFVAGSVHHVAALGDGTVFLSDACDGTTDGFSYATGGEVRSLPALADIDGDGEKDIVLFSGTKIFALNRTGAPLDNFPITVGTDSVLSGTPVVADLNGDGTLEIAGVTSGGVVFAYGPDGRMIAGFPIQAGQNAGVTPAVYYTQSSCLSCADIALAVATADGYVYAWRTGTVVTGPALPPEQPWPQFAHDAGNHASESVAPVPVPRSDDFLPASLTYNWPNPVGREEGFRTFIRYYVPVDATVTIRIFNLAGELVESFEGLHATGGVDNETAWDVSEVESGIYFASIEAAGAGRSGNAVIRIAVVR